MNRGVLVDMGLDLGCWPTVRCIECVPESVSMFFSIGLAMISLCLKAIEDPSVPAAMSHAHVSSQVILELQSHTDSTDRLKFMTKDVLELLCELLHDPTELLVEIERHTTHK